jgi:hypothetical protein
MDAYWMMPIMGACQLGAFAGFAIYLPELFPSSMRSTGTSLCFNLVSFAALKRETWNSRAAAARSRETENDSPMIASEVSSLKSTSGTSICMSMRSSNGSLIFWR